MTKAAVLVVIPLLISGSAALAEATDAGAAHLTEVFQTYLGATDGVVSVEVDGEDYVLTLDAAPLMAKAAEQGATASLTPLVMTLTDNGDGTWDVSQDQAVSLSVAVPGATDMKQDIASLKTEGVFDESLMSFTSAKGEMTGIKVSQSMTTPDQPPMAIEMAVASGTFDTTSTAGAAGGVDNTVTMALTGLSESFTTPAQDGMPAMPVSITAESISQTGTLNGLRPDAFYKTLAWFVAHPDEAAMMADKATMKTILQEGLPLFSMLSVNSTIKNVAVTTPMGNVGMAELGVLVDMNGVVPEGKFREAITVSGLTLPEGVIPAWVTPILPQKFSLDVQVTDFDPAAAATVAFGLFDLPNGTSPDAAFDAAMQQALLPKGTVTIALNPGSVSGDGYELTYQGAMVAGPDMTIPTGKATITLTGLDKLQAALAAAPDDIKGQAMMGMGMVQGMAKPGDNGALVWEIDASTPGSLSVNGTPMMGGN